MSEKDGNDQHQEASIKVRRVRRRIYQQPQAQVGQASPPTETGQVEPSPVPTESILLPQGGPDRFSAPSGVEPAPPVKPTASIQTQTPPPGAGGDVGGLDLSGRRLIRRYMALSMGAGLIPAPLIDTLVLGALQLLLIRDLAQLHGAEFSPARGRALLAALLGSAGTVSVATGYLASLVKLLPVVGYGAGAATMPVLAGAATFAVGRVFQRHFAGGGNLWDFDAAEKAPEMNDALAEGRRLADTSRPKG